MRALIACLALILCWPFAVGATTFDEAPEPGRQFPALQQLLTGNYSAPYPGTEPYFGVSDRHPLEATLQLLAKGQLTAAKDSLAATDSLVVRQQGIAVPFLKQAIAYLERYTQGDLHAAAQAPMFEGFNGGFATFAFRGLGWDTLKALPKEVYDTTVATWMEVIHRGQIAPCPGIYYEMMGDLLLRHDSRLQGRWMAALAYLRAGKEYGNAAIADRYRTKAIYAMESHQLDPKTFNKYRFKQLEETFLAEWEKGSELRKALMAKSLRPEDQKSDLLLGPITAFGTYFPATGQADDPISLLMEKDAAISGELVEGDPNRETMNRDIDLRKIKSVPLHNIFAISMILLVIASAFYFYLRLKRRAKELEQEELAEDARKAAAAHGKTSSPSADV